MLKLPQLPKTAGFSKKALNLTTCGLRSAVCGRHHHHHHHHRHRHRHHHHDHDHAHAHARDRGGGGGGGGGGRGGGRVSGVLMVC